MISLAFRRKSGDPAALAELATQVRGLMSLARGCGFVHVQRLQISSPGMSVLQTRYVSFDDDIASGIDDVYHCVRGLGLGLWFEMVRTRSIARGNIERFAPGHPLNIHKSRIFHDLNPKIASEMDAKITREVLDRLSRVHDVLMRMSCSESPQRAGPAQAVLRLVSSCTVWLLSASARVRFTEELRDELYDLADQRASWRSQVFCALRQLAQVRQLRAAARAGRTSPGSVPAGE